MGLRAAKAALASALRQGDFAHENRDPEKNVLAMGDIEPEDVARLVLKTRAHEYQASPHHWDSSVTVHTFRPAADDQRWYIKAYFLDGPDGGATFISVHQAGAAR